MYWEGANGKHMLWLVHLQFGNFLILFITKDILKDFTIWPIIILNWPIDCVKYYRGWNCPWFDLEGETFAILYNLLKLDQERCDLNAFECNLIDHPPLRGWHKNISYPTPCDLHMFRFKITFSPCLQLIKSIGTKHLQGQSHYLSLHPWPPYLGVLFIPGLYPTHK